MTTKNNKEIVIEELGMFATDYDITFHNVPKNKKVIELYEQFATTLLPKLNKLDRKSIENIFYQNACSSNEFQCPVITEEFFNHVIDLVLSLIPEQGEVKEWKEKYRLEKLTVDRLIRYKRKLEKRLTEKELKKIFNRMKIRLTKGKPKKVLYTINTDDWKYLISQIMKI